MQLFSIRRSHFWTEKYTKFGLHTANFIAYLYLSLQRSNYNQLSLQKHSSHLVDIPEIFNKPREGFAYSKKVHKYYFSQ